MEGSSLQNEVPTQEFQALTSLLNANALVTRGPDHWLRFSELDGIHHGVILKLCRDGVLMAAEDDFGELVLAVDPSTFRFVPCLGL